MFLDNFDGFNDVIKLLMNHFKNGPAVDNKRSTNFSEEIEQQTNDKNWKPSFQEFTDLITAFHVNDNDFFALIGRGFISKLYK